MTAQVGHDDFANAFGHIDTNIYKCRNRGGGDEKTESWETLIAQCGGFGNNGLSLRVNLHDIRVNLGVNPWELWCQSDDTQHAIFV